MEQVHTFARIIIDTRYHSTKMFTLPEKLKKNVILGIPVLRVKPSPEKFDGDLYWELSLTLAPKTSIQS